MQKKEKRERVKKEKIIESTKRTTRANLCEKNVKCETRSLFIQLVWNICNVKVSVRMYLCVCVCAS